MTLSTFLQRMTRWLTTERSERCADAADHVETESTYETAACATHHISRALDGAMERGLYEHAERIVRSALRLREVMTPQLIERIARLKLIQGRPDDALQIIESGWEQTSSLRLLRIVCQLLVDRRLDAHIDLHRWSRHNTCPLEARCLLALLEDEQGHADNAQRELLKNIRQLDDPQSYELMVLISAGRERRDQAAVWGRRLLQLLQSRSAALSPRLLVDSFNLPANASISITEEDIESLSAELVVNEPVIPALAAAQELEPEPDMARLLYQAVERALPELSRHDAALESLARLAIVLDERDRAMHWIQTAIDENRITASMARFVRDQISSEFTDNTRRPLSCDDEAGVIGRVLDALPEDDEDDTPTGSKQWKRAA